MTTCNLSVLIAAIYAVCRQLSVHALPVRPALVLCFLLAVLIVFLYEL